MDSLPFEITRHRLSLPGISEKISLIHLTDFHAGNPRTEHILKAAVEWTTSQRADYVVMTGDYIDTRDEQIQDAQRILGNLRANRGIYAVLGNHDYRVRYCPVDSALGGFRVLDNESERLPCGIWIAGVDDLDVGGGSVAAAIARIPKDSAAILLSHNPNAIDFIPPGRSATVLAGHTHGGQINLPFPGPTLVCRLKLGTRYAAGWYEKGDSRLYVNRGLGVTGRPPFNRRFNCPPEVAVFDIAPE